MAQGNKPSKYGQDETIVIWDNEKAPHSNGLTGEAYEKKPYRLTNTTKTILYAFNADKAKATGQAIVICPGGGYAMLSMNQEGYMMAQWLAKNGITAFVLEYRLPNGHKEVPLEDAVEAIRFVRKNAKKYNIDPAKVGIMGFSAGGHLAASASNIPPVADRPNFSVLFYPVVIANHYTSHVGSFRNLLGKGFTQADADKFSMEKIASENTPPTILLLSDDDATVPAAGAAIYYAALRYHGVKAAMYIFPSGGHGWGNYDTFSYQKEWQQLLLRWLCELSK
ncbi:MAG: alpha/beta hydrolase [Alistipes sp.]|nr:alpha/beta hydrolase [Alistipes sp.]